MPPGLNALKKLRAGGMRAQPLKIIKIIEVVMFEVDFNFLDVRWCPWRGLRYVRFDFEV